MCFQPLIQVLDQLVDGAALHPRRDFLGEQFEQQLAGHGSQPLNLCPVAGQGVLKNGHEQTTPE
jgi:hypothetical protein